MALAVATQAPGMAVDLWRALKAFTSALRRGAPLVTHTATLLTAAQAMSENLQLLQGDYIRRRPLQQMLPPPAVAGHLQLLCLMTMTRLRKHEKTENNLNNNQPIQAQFSASSLWVVARTSIARRTGSPATNIWRQVKTERWKELQFRLGNSHRAKPVDVGRAIHIVPCQKTTTTSGLPLRKVD